MKIAAVTDDGERISQHFGRASHYQVLTVEDGRIVDRELRDKVGHNRFAHEGHPSGSAERPHGTGPEAQSRHAKMAETISDCQVVLCGGMGMGAYRNLMDLGIRPILTEIEGIQEAAQAYIDGRLIERVDRLH
jgi:predicted Fe-Mo cluster-binding NifX family protein